MALKLLTRAQMRDEIRRMLQLVPLVDFQYPAHAGQCGQPSTQQPNPPNTTINDAIDRAVSAINLATGFSVHTLDIPITQASLPSSTSVGPLQYDIGAMTIPVNLVNQIRYIQWIPDGGVSSRIYPASREEFDRRQYQWRIQAPGVPTGFWMEGNILYVLPWPNTAGTFEILAGTGLFSFTGDTDVINDMPVEHQPTVIYGTVIQLSKLQTMNVEARERASNFLPDYTDALSKFVAFLKGENNDEQQPVLAYTGRYRQGYGLRRIRR